MGSSERVSSEGGRLSRLLKTLGPGILFASTAIGVSHLVQSTRAGAEYAFTLLWAIALANLFKYPFFEYGSRYANVKSESIIDGYHRIGKWMLILYFLITIGSMFFVTAAVGFVTAGFMENLFGLTDKVPFQSFTSIILFAICLCVLIVGNYGALDKLIKLIGSVMLICTVVAFFIALQHGPRTELPGFSPTAIPVDIVFLIALMGWMPTAVDLSAWNSLWTLERIKQSGYRPTLKETLFDFNLGYIVSAVLSICFVTLGAFLLFGSGVDMPDSKALFANKIVGLYTETFGQWSYLIIAAAAFSIMFGTSIGVFDGYARALERTSELLFFPKQQADEMLNDRRLYIISLCVVAAGAFVIILFFSASFTLLVDVATTISFLISPVIAVANLYLVSGKGFPSDKRPPMWMKLLSWAGVLFLTGFSVFYLGYKLAPG